MKTKSIFASVALAAALAFLSAAVTTGCTSTRAAYSEAQTLEERAYVVTEHYSAVLKQAADLKDRGVLKGEPLKRAREAELVAGPVVLSLGNLVDKYKAARDAESEVALQGALDAAVLALADLVRVVKAAAGGAS